MTIRQARAVAPPTYPRNQAADERRQREFELNGALDAARKLQAKLELCGDRAADVAVIRSLRDSLSRDLGALDSVVSEPPYVPTTDYASSADESSSSGDWLADAVRADEIERTGR